jgi:hypothetical protein
LPSTCQLHDGQVPATSAPYEKLTGQKPQRRWPAQRPGPVSASMPATTRSVKQARTSGAGRSSSMS